MKIKSIFFFVFISLATFSVSCGGKKINVDTSKTIKIGKQEWKDKNLNVDHFRNGDAIPEVTSNAEWRKASDDGKPAFCYYENNSDNGDKYGIIYNWYAVNDARGLAPAGWHVASQEEWKQLIDTLNADNNACNKLKSKTGWNDDNKGTNETGFTALPGGVRSFQGDFSGVETSTSWWTSTTRGSEDPEAYSRTMSNVNSFVDEGSPSAGCGYYVRCVKD